MAVTLLIVCAASIVLLIMWRETPLALSCAYTPNAVSHWFDRTCSQREEHCGDAFPEELRCCGDGTLECAPEREPPPGLCAADTGISAHYESYDAPCAEWDNVRVAFKRSGSARAPEEVRVTMTHPRYGNATNLNRMEARFCDCSSEGPPVRRLATGTHCEYSNKKIYDDGELVIIAWCDPSWAYKKMDLADGRGRLPLMATNIEVYVRVPGTSNYAGVLVLYQNGYSRMLPMPASEADVPFGTSVVVGPSRDGSFPVASIMELEIISVVGSVLTLGMMFESGNAEQVTLEYTPSERESVARIRGLSWAEEGRAYVRMSSMFVQPGVADAEVLIDGRGAKHAVTHMPPPPKVDASAWQYLQGPSWTLQKECVSIHNTMAPDTRLDLLCDPSAVRAV